MVQKVAKYANTRRFKKEFVFLGVFIGFLFLVAGIVPLFSSTQPYYNEGYTLSPSESNSGEPLNVTVHQSKLEQGNPLYTILSTSDLSNNTFNTITPKDTKFNTTSQHIKIENLYAPNVSIIYEDETGIEGDTETMLLDSRYGVSFEIKGSGFLENVSFYLSNEESVNGNLTLQVYNSKYSQTQGGYLPDTLYTNLASGKTIEPGFNGWYTFSNRIYLDTSQTEDNTFLLSLEDKEDITNLHYIFHKSAEPSDGSNDLDCSKEENPNDWNIIKIGGSEIDFLLKGDFSPQTHYPNATDINLQVNDKAVSDLSNGEGLWKDKETYNILPNSIEFSMTAEWWDVSCNITKILVNYTRTDLKTTTVYNFDNSQNAVQWNATLGSFNSFDNGFSNYRINFTIPETWENPTAFNASEPIIGNTQLGPLKNGYREFEICSASNGTNWYITAEVSRLETDMNIISKPDKIQPGNDFDITFYVTYFNGSNDVPFQGVEVAVETYINDELDRVETDSTDEQGIVLFRMFVPNDAASIYLSVNLPGTIEHTSTSFQITDISIINPSSSPTGINLIELVPIIIIIGIVGSASIGAVGVYKGVIIPKKRREDNALEEIKTIFDDAINIEYIVVIYKESGVSIFFKSMGLENVDPDLISGFISAVSSFGAKIELQESLTEMKYGEKSLLLSDGKYIRVGIVLSKKGSKLMRTHLKQFVEEFEERYADVLPNWQSSLLIFRDADDLVDKIFNTSIILPHIVKYTISDIKNLKHNVSKNILYEADTLLDEPGRDYFFIGKILSRVQEETKKEVGEIFMGIRELREKGLLIPLDLSEIGEEGNYCRDENKKVLKTIFNGSA